MLYATYAPLNDVYQKAKVVFGRMRLLLFFSFSTFLADDKPKHVQLAGWFLVIACVKRWNTETVIKVTLFGCAVGNFQQYKSNALLRICDVQL